MFHTQSQTLFREQLQSIRDAGTLKEEHIMTSSQSAKVTLQNKPQEILNFCANNYLGLSNDSKLIDAAKATLDSHGLGLSSVRFICGTQDIHKQLEQSISQFHQTEDTILYPSCFDANGGLFETLLTAEDAVLSDALNHASIIDGIRLCKAKRFRYKHGDMQDLEARLQAAQDCRLRLIATDGVFSMDGFLAKLDQICDLADRYNAMVMIDECHATGFVGPTGRGTPEQFGVMDRVDIITSTLGKALGGASGGYTTGRREIIDLLRQRSRPYLFSNTIAPPLVGAAIKVFERLSASTQLRDTLEQNTQHFRKSMTQAGFSIQPGGHPIVPIMLGDAKLASTFAAEMVARNIYVVGFSYPVVPKGEARIRVQLSAAHTRKHLERAIAAFIEVGKKLNVLS